MTRGTSAQASEQIKPGTLTLAPLPDAKGGCDAALQFQDWLEVAGSVFADVSELSGQWWKDVVTKVEDTYSTWLAATPLERLSITPVGSDDLVGGRWTRLNARVSSMLLTAMGDSLRSDMVAQRLTQDAVRMVFRLHTTFQPGGSAERHDVLRRLQAPQEYVPTESLEDALKSIRAWPRWLARCKAVNMNPPDASVLARGLMAMSSRHISASPDAAFRTSMLRTSLRLDAQPSLEQVTAYQRHLQAELETLVSASVTSTLSQPGLRAIEKTTSPPKGNRDTKEKGADKGASTVDACRYFMKPSGCKRGSRCTFSHSMASLDKETRSRKCLQCGSEAHRQRDCPVAKGGPKGSTSVSSPTARGHRQAEPQAPTVSTVTPCTTPSGTVMSTSSTVPGTPWTLEALMQAAQQVVQAQGSDGREDSSPEKVKPEVRTLKVKDIKISSLTTSSAALLDSGATHSLRNAYDKDEWDEAEDVVVELAGKSKLTMKLSSGGTLLMPPRSTRKVSPSEAAQGNTIVSMGELVRTLGYTLEWGPNRCLLRTEEGEEIALATHGGCPYLCEAEALSLISRLEDRKRERLENETTTTMDRIELAALRMDRHWMDNLCDFAGDGSLEAGVRSLRDADFLRHLPAECLDGLLPDGLKDEGWSIMRRVNFLTRAQRRYLWGAKKWLVHLYAGGEGHQLDSGDTAVIELDLQRCKGHDVMSTPVWRMLMWGAVNGKIDGVIGGPPGRGGVNNYVDSEDNKDLKPMRLIARMMWLYATATAARRSAAAGGNKGRPVAFMLEHPAKEMSKGASLWDLPVWTEFQNDMGMSQVTFNQGAMGGESIKTTLGTNVYYLMGLDQVGVEGEIKGDYLAGSSGVWSPGFVNALVLAMKFWDKTPRTGRVVEGDDGQGVELHQMITDWTWDKIKINRKSSSLTRKSQDLLYHNHTKEEAYSNQVKLGKSSSLTRKSQDLLYHNHTKEEAYSNQVKLGKSSSLTRKSRDLLYHNHTKEEAYSNQVKLGKSSSLTRKSRDLLYHNHTKEEAYSNQVKLGKSSSLTRKSRDLLYHNHTKEEAYSNQVKLGKSSSLTRKSRDLLYHNHTKEGGQYLMSWSSHEGILLISMSWSSHEGIYH
eukprot:s2146_g6.t1